MKKNSESNDTFFIYRDINDRISTYRKTEEGKVTRVPLRHLYSIKYTMAGPIAKQMVTLNDAMSNPEEYEKIADKGNLFTYPHAKELIVKWFLERAQTIDDMTEEQYIGGIPTEDLWRQYCVANTKKLEESSLARGD
jgi:hypothetical protein